MSQPEVTIVTLPFPVFQTPEGQHAMDRIRAREDARRAQLTPLERDIEDAIEESVLRAIVGL